MGFSCGIVGLPNVGKSTLFNAITKSSVEAANYPFCTIDPNHGVVAVPDERLDVLTRLCESKKTIATTVEFIDIAGLVKGASKGEGLGNQFLSHIRQVDAIVQVVRIFENPNITREAPLDPLGDLEIIHTELILADLDTIHKRLSGIEKNLRAGGDKEARQVKEVLDRAVAHLGAGQLMNRFTHTDEEWKLALRDLHLLTIKPMLIVANVDENEVAAPEKNKHWAPLAGYCSQSGFELIPLSAKLECEVSDLSKTDPAGAKEYLAGCGLTAPGLERLIVAGYRLLKLLTFFTAGEKETRAWTVHAGTLAPQAAGVIHSDFEKGFIKAEIVSYEDLTQLGSYAKARETGKLRIEGKSYPIQDGDVCHFKFNV